MDMTFGLFLGPDDETRVGEFSETPSPRSIRFKSKNWAPFTLYCLRKTKCNDSKPYEPIRR